MTKRYLLDIISIVVLALFIPLLVINRPEISYNERPVTRHITEVKERAEEKGREKVTQTAGFPHLEERNIFSPDGAYIISKGKTPLTGASYRLIGVLTSGLKRAVIADYAGEVFILKERESLADGSVISRLGNTSVTLKRGKKERELKIFDIGEKRN